MARKATMALLQVVTAVIVAATSVVAGAWRGPRVVLSPETLNRLSEYAIRLCRVQEPPYWTPREADIVLAESALAGGLPKAATSYGRQYLGITMSGRRVLQVRGFCREYYHDDPARPWERTPLMLLEAGACAFQADYDMAQGVLSDIEWGT
jgi:hypothetical protein